MNDAYYQQGEEEYWLRDYNGDPCDWCIHQFDDPPEACEKCPYFHLEPGEVDEDE